MFKATPEPPSLKYKLDNTMRTSSRRFFLQQLSIASSALLLPVSFNVACTNGKKATTRQTPLTFGIIADPHADLIPDKMERLEKFIECAITKEVDFLIQLGDFCFPKKENLDFLGLWNQFKGPKYHVLGNHDMDVSSKEETMEFIGMPAKYYSFDQKGVHFVVLDANYLFVDHQYKDYDHANFYVDSQFRTFVNPAQLEWLAQDLQQTNLPTIIFSHQSLINPGWGIKNRLQIQHLLEKENQRVGFQKVIACFNGHDHIDFQRTLNDIHYIEINSMSYQWLGVKYSNKTRYAPNLYEQYQHLDKLGPYKDSLFAFVALDIQQGWLKMDGVQSEWLPPSPADLNMPEQVYGMQSSAVIANRDLHWKAGISPE